MPNNNWQIFNPPIGPGNAVPQQEHLVGMGPAVIWDEVAALPEAPQGHLDALNQVLEGNLFDANAQMYYQAYKDKDMFTKKSKTRATPSTSQLSDEYRVLTSQIRELKGSLQQESEELASVLEKIATQVEVVRDIGSLIHTRISSLQKAANQLENWRLSLPQPDSPDSQKGPSAGRYEPAPTLQPAQAGQVQVGPGLWQQDQG